jgi:hypothetical protein
MDAHRRAFRYAVFMAAIDLDELDELDAQLHLFSRDRANLFAFRDRDYASATAPSTATTSRDLRGEFAALRAANDLPVPATSRLVTNLRAFGYLFNPVSFCLDYDTAGTITSVIAEINNTYGGNLRYVLGPRDRIEGGFRHVRELFVSPFLHGDATYDFLFDAPLDGDVLDIRMNVYAGRPANLGDRTFFARFSGTRRSLSDTTLALAALRYPFMTAQVIGLIHWQALKLRFAGAPYHRPDADHRPLHRSPIPR